MPGRRSKRDAYSIGLQLGEEGQVWDAIVGGPAFKAGISSGMKVIGVNGRMYNHDLLEDAIKAAKNSGAPISLLVLNDEYYPRPTSITMAACAIRTSSATNAKPDYLDELIKAHAAQ